MPLPDAATLQLAAAWLSVIAAAGGVATLFLGLSSVLTGKDYWPHQLRRLRPRRPATVEDQRRYGIFQLLMAAAVLIIILGSSLTIFGARDHSQGEPLNTLRFVITVIGLTGAMVCVGGAYRIGLAVKYTLPETPPA